MMKFHFGKHKIIESPTDLMSGEAPDSFVDQLKRRGYTTDEDDLIRCIEDGKSKNLVYYATVCLQQYGTVKCIPILKDLVSYPIDDVKVCTVLAIGRIAGKDETPYYAELLDSKFRHKDYVMSVIWKVGDDRAYSSVLKLAHKVLANKLKLQSQSDVLYITQYLERVSKSSDDTHTVDRLLKMRGSLPDF